MNIKQRRYEIINIPHDFCAYQSTSSWVCPCTVAMLKAKNSGIVKGSLYSSIVVVSIACPIHIGLEQGSWRFTLKNRHPSLLCKVYGAKNDDSAVYLGYVTLLYLL